MYNVEPTRRRAYLITCRILAAVSTVTALVYLKWLLFDARADNVYLFALLLSAELFNVSQAAGFWYTIATQKFTEPMVPNFLGTSETVDVFITVCGEPTAVVERTVDGAVGIRHPRKRVWILDDGKSAEIEALAARYGAGYLTRPTNRGAKAGNINDALERTNSTFVVIFDADHAPQPEFLERTLGGFADPKVAFVQTPQYYANQTVNRVAAGANEQQSLFYGPILRGKNARGAVFSCGTNVIFRRSSLKSVGGMPEDSVTEDLRVSLIMTKAGFTSLYVPIVLAYGMGPLDVRSFFKQQRRWASGGLEILFKRRPFGRRMGFGEIIEYFLGFWYWFTGWAYLAYLILPVAFLLFGLRPVQVPNQYPVYFLPYISFTLITIAYASDFRLTFRGLWFTLASFATFIGSFFTAIFVRRSRFAVTSKRGAGRTPLAAWPQMTAIAILVFSIGWGLWFRGVNPSVLNNVAFALGHILILQGFVRYAMRPEGSDWLTRDRNAELMAAQAQMRSFDADTEEASA